MQRNITLKQEKEPLCEETTADEENKESISQHYTFSVIRIYYLHRKGKEG